MFSRQMRALSRTRVRSPPYCMTILVEFSAQMTLHAPKIHILIKLQTTQKNPSLIPPPNPSIWSGFLSPVSAPEVLKTIRESPAGKAPGYYEVPMDMVKALVKENGEGNVFLRILTSLLNGLLSLRGNTPATKPSILVLLRKNSNSATIPNLRPISLISTLSKILSKILRSSVRHNSLS